LNLELGARLEYIFSLVNRAQLPKKPMLPASYDRIWDCCCDHGYLGIKMLQQHIPGTICFVDQVPHITQKLNETLDKLSLERYEVYTDDASNLRFSEGDRHLVILAGVTGTNVITILNRILDKHAHQNIDFIVCPTRGGFDVRRCMIDKQLYLINESIVSENDRQYEVIYAGGSNERETRYLVSEVGAMWDKGSAEHLSYLEGRISHYQRESKGQGRAEAAYALGCYQGVLSKIS